MAALRRAGHDRLLAIHADPGHPEPGVVWSLPVEPDALSIMIGSHTGCDVLFVTQDASLALLADGEELLVVAGPPAFVLDAVGGDAALAVRQWEEDRVAATNYRRIDAHYAPFALSGGTPAVA